MSPRHLRRLAAAGTGLVLAAGVIGCTTEPSPEVAVRTFLIDWQAGEYEDAARKTNGDVEEVADTLAQARRQLDLAALRFSLGPIAREGTSARAEFEVQADLGIGDPVWSYTGSMSLHEGPQGWEIDWSPSVVHPDLGKDERLAVSYDVPDRGQVYDREDKPLVAEQRVTAFGVVPAKMDDPEKGVQRLAELLDEDPDPLLDRVRSAPPEKFQPLVLKRTKDIRRSVLKRAGRIAGVETSELRMPLNPKLAEGVVGEAAGTAEHKISSRVASTYQAGDTVGLSGLQNAFQKQLAGTATTEVVTLDGDGNQTGVLKRWPGTESGSVTTTIDSDVQEAGEGALSMLPGKGYMVALDSRSGEILAAASASDSPNDDGAFTKEYRPAETFTIVSSAAALQSGAVRPGQTVPCDREVKVGDRRFTNPNNNQLWGKPDLSRDFTYTCTTAFAGLAGDVGAEAVSKAAADFGIGTDWRMSVPTFAGEFDAPTSESETAAAMVGRDQVEVSPLSMALVAGAVADGSWHAPRLATEAGDTTTNKPAASRELDPDTVKQLREMMRSAVVEGRGSAANVGLTPVHGQIATVEQEVDGEKTAVQWFVGYQGDLAFAVAAEVDPDMQWEQFAVTTASSFLQRLPLNYVERMAEGEDDSGGGPVPDTGG